MKALVVGLEGLSLELALRWAQAGDLPALESFIREGTWGRLNSVPNLNPVSAWLSFASGLEPGKHGVFSFKDIAPSSLRGWRGEAFWDRLVNLGYSVGLINVPLAYPTGCTPKGVNVYGYRGRDFSYRLETVVGRLASRGRWDQAARAIEESLEAQREFVAHVLRKDSPDFLVVVFTTAEIAQRFFWRFFAPQAFGIEAPENSDLAHFIRKVYRRLDRVLREVIEMASPETMVVISSHGCGVNQRGAECLPGWLENVGLLHIHPQHRELWHKFIDSEAVATKFDGWRPWLRSETLLKAVDWSRTQAYAMGTDEVYISLEGREPEGIVSESQYEVLCGEIVERLKQAIDPVTKESTVADVVLGRDVYDGPFAHRAPDVLIRWRGERMLNGLETPGYEPVYNRGVPTITGSSRPNGIFLALGPEIRKGFEISSAHITDLPATLLYLFGEEVPAYMDGYVMTHIFDAEWVAFHPVMVEEELIRQLRQKETLRTDADDEMKSVEERLRGLGYID